MKDSQARQNYDVIIAGGGPAGLILAIDLGQRGVPVLLLEKNSGTSPWPKMERTNARSMEIFRRLGLAEEIRSVGYPEDASMDVFIVNTLSDALLRLPYPTVAEQREAIQSERQGRMPLEPYQLVSQYALEPVLKRHAESLESVTVRFGVEVVGFVQDDAGVTVEVRERSGETARYAGQYLVGCDGGASPIRKALGIKLDGRGGIQRKSQVQFRSEDLYEKIPVGKGRHYYFPDGSIVVTQGNRIDFTFHTPLTGEADYEAEIRAHIPVDFEMEILRVNEWTLHLLAADRYRERRVFLVSCA